MGNRRFSRKSRAFAQKLKRGEAAIGRTSFVADAWIDLHGLRADEALRRVRQAVEGGEYRGKSLAIVHGKGQGVLREATRRYASSAPEIKRVWNGEDVFLPEGDGMTIFFL